MIFVCLLIFTVAVIPLFSLIINPVGNSQLPIQSAVSETTQTTSQSTQTAQTAQLHTDNFRIYDNSLKKIITVTDTEFCIGAVAAETDIDIPYEALKAEIVAIHTYYAYLRQQSRNEKKEFDFECNSKTWKVYVSQNQLKEKLRDTFDDYYSTVKNAVDEVIHCFVLYNGKLCKTAYFEISSGNTFSYNEIYNEDIPYLYSVPSPFDRLANNYTTQQTFSFSEFNQKISEHFSDYKPAETHAENIKDIVKSENGAITTLIAGNRKMTGKQFADIFCLRSSCFAIAFRNNQYTITVYGHGENIGMSKFGACRLAEQGYTFTEILQYYYTDITVSEN